MLQVSPHFLEQTLDKKLMSDLRVRNQSVFCSDSLKLFSHLIICLCPEKENGPRTGQRAFCFRGVLLWQEVGRRRPKGEAGHQHGQPDRLGGLRRLRSRFGGRDVRWEEQLSLKRASNPLSFSECHRLCAAPFRGAHRGGGGAVPAGSLLAQLRRKVPGLPGGHVQRRDRGGEAAVHPRAEGDLHPHHAQRGPAGHRARRPGGNPQPDVI